MKKYLVMLMVLALASIPCVAAQTASPRISPMWPVMVESSYIFDVWAQNADVYNVRVLFVITEECLDGMADGTVVTVNGETITKTEFAVNGIESGEVPPSAGAPYQASSLKDHIDEGLAVPLGSDDTIYWAISTVVFPVLTGTHDTLDVELTSSSPRMLVYLMGNLENDPGMILDTRTPPTNPGFMVPEVAIGSIMAVAAMFTALSLYTYKRKQKI